MRYILIILFLLACQQSPTEPQVKIEIETQYILTNGFALYYNVFDEYDYGKNAYWVLYNWYITKTSDASIDSVWVVGYMLGTDPNTGLTISILDMSTQLAFPPDSLKWNKLDDASGVLRSNRTFVSFVDVWPGMEVVAK